MSEYYGHMTMEDGSHVPLTREQAKAMMDQVDAAQAKRAADMPTEQDALHAMFQAWVRLKELGWSEAIYCPKDGSPFDVIEAGSTGIFRCSYNGQWPTGSYWLQDAGDIWPSNPILFRLDPEARAVRDAKMKAAAERFARESS